MWKILTKTLLLLGGHLGRGWQGSQPPGMACLSHVLRELHSQHCPWLLLSIFSIVCISCPEHPWVSKLSGLQLYSFSLWQTWESTQMCMLSTACLNVLLLLLKESTRGDGLVKEKQLCEWSTLALSLSWLRSSFREESGAFPPLLQVPCLSWKCWNVRQALASPAWALITSVLLPGDP